MVHRRDLTGGQPNYMTSSGFENLNAEFEKLQTERKALTALAGHDRDERLRTLDARLDVLATARETAQVIHPGQQQGDRIVFGATVTVHDEDENERVYQIVGVDESDAAAGRVSWISPVAKALLQAKVGDVVKLKTPLKSEELEIKKIEFK